ncbi:molybdenum cofactor guanylyltransferase [Rubrobacter aplysinae]|uniref:molybdenum cofactor guanylyltransferase n=1 Tax=Rubrobacter aplysinae TaxID=909625 RepID=UPI00064BBB2D|nr:molybdenum cofactor guanylyltransferase [Rubrobacter aplysinae]
MTRETREAREKRASGVVLAGGQSRRMGRDKLALTVDGVPILRRVYDALDEVCEEVVVVTVGDEEPVGLPDGARLARDMRPGGPGGGAAGAGPLAGLEAGLRQARYPAAFVAAGDMPYLSPGLVRETLRRLRAGGAHAVLPRYRGRREPLCAAYDAGALVAVGEALDAGVSAMRELIERLPEVEEIAEDELRRFGEPELLLMNVNSPEDLARARAVTGERDG